MKNTIHWINHSPVDGLVCFVNTCSLDGDLPVRLCCRPFEQLGPDNYQVYGCQRDPSLPASLIPRAFPTEIRKNEVDFRLQVLCSKQDLV